MNNTQDCKESQFKQPFFHWTKELVAEFAREVSRLYKNADVWSGDLQAEKQLADAFIKRKKFEEIQEGMFLNETEETFIVDKLKFNETIKFLYNYKDSDC